MTVGTPMGPDLNRLGELLHPDADQDSRRRAVLPRCDRPRELADDLVAATGSVLLFLDQFEDVDIPFGKAPGVKMGRLRYYPKTTSNADMIELLGFQIGRRFLTLLTKTYTVKKGDNSFLVDDVIPSPREIEPDVPQQISNLVMECIRTNPSRRPELAELIRRLEVMEFALRRRAAVA